MMKSIDETLKCTECNDIVFKKIAGTRTIECENCGNQMTLKEN